MYELPVLPEHLQSSHSVGAAESQKLRIPADPSTWPPVLDVGRVALILGLRPKKELQ